jgi:ribosomal protein L18E
MLLDVKIVAYDLNNNLLSLNGAKMRNIVDLLLDEIREETKSFSNEEKLELIQRLCQALTSPENHRSQVNLVSDINQIGERNRIDFVPRQDQ